MTRALRRPVIRGAHREETNQVVIDWLKDKTKIEAMETLCQAGVPVGAVRDTLEVLNDPDLRRRGIFVTVDDPDRGSVTIPGWPIKMSDAHVPVRAAPRPGEHNEEILGGLLGMSAGEIAELTQTPDLR